MIKQVIHKSFSVILALLVFFSTVSFTIEKHFCGDVLVDVSVFVEAENCAGDVESSSHGEMKKKSCCKDEIEVVKGQDELLKSFNDLKVEQQYFLKVLIASYLNLFEGEPKKVIPHKDYSPPNLVRDVQVLDQVFLI